MNCKSIKVINSHTEGLLFNYKCRYNIVLNIFKEHSRTKVAKLQVALAEIPLIR